MNGRTAIIVPEKATKKGALNKPRL